MADEGGVAVAEVVEQPINTEIDGGESSSSTSGERASRAEADPDRQDGRQQPDALKKHIAELRRRADALTDPVEKKAELDRIKFLYDTSGKARGYEKEFPTVREAREVRALIEAVGGREGVQQMQATISELEQIDKALSAGDPSVVQKLWDEAPDGMPKLMPALLQKFEQSKPEDYKKFIAPVAIGHLDKSGFPQAFDRMCQLYGTGKTAEAEAIRDQLIEWVIGNRQQGQQQKQVDPEVERLRQQLAERDQGEESKKVDSAYNDVVSHAGPEIDRIARPIIGKLNLSKDEGNAFRQAVWNHLQESRNAHADYKTIAPAKQRQGYDKWTDYAKRWTTDNAEASIRAVLKTPPWSRIATSKPAVVATKTPGTQNVQTGKEPSPSEINYSTGKAQLQKAGVWKSQYRDLADALLDGIYPLKSGQIRKRA